MERIRIATSSDLAEGTSVRFRARWRGEEVGAFAIRFEGTVRAWVNRCTHREIELDLGNGAFFHPTKPGLLLCRAHGAVFDARTGDCANGMCGKGTALSTIPTEESEGVVYALVE